MRDVRLTWFMRKGYLWDASLGPVHRTRARGFDFDWDRCIGRGQGALRVVHEASLRTSARHFFLFRSFFPCSSPSPLLLTLHAPPPSHFCPPSLLPHVPAPIPPHLRLSLSSTYRAPFPPFFPSNESSTLLPSAASFLHALRPGLPLLLPFLPSPPAPFKLPDLSPMSIWMLDFDEWMWVSSLGIGMTTRIKFQSSGIFKLSFKETVSLKLFWKPVFLTAITRN